MEKEKGKEQNGGHRHGLGTMSKKKEKAGKSDGRITTTKEKEKESGINHISQEKGITKEASDGKEKEAVARKLTIGKATKEIGKAAAARTNGNTEKIKAIGTVAVKAKEAKESGGHTKERIGTMEETRGYKTLAMTRTRSTPGTRHMQKNSHIKSMR